MIMASARVLLLEVTDGVFMINLKEDPIRHTVMSKKKPKKKPGLSILLCNGNSLHNYHKDSVGHGLHICFVQELAQFNP